MKATLLLILLCVIVYPYGLSHIGELAYSFNNAIVLHHYQVLVTSLFVHANFMHLAGNMFFLFFFGRSLEKSIGPWGFLACFLAGGVFGNLASYFFYDRAELCIGASGAISAIIATMMLYNPWKFSFFLNFFPMPLGVAAISYFAMNLIMSQYSKHHHDSSGTHIGYEIHLAGFAFGLIYGSINNPNWKKNLIISLLLFIAFLLLLRVVIYFL